MDYHDFERTLQQIGLTKKGFANLMGLHSTTITNYAGSSMPRHLAIIAVLCKELHHSGVDFQHVLEQIPLAQKKARPKVFQGDPQRALF